MRVILAGYNIDSSLISKLDPEQATPEVISAAYARISRSTKSVDELRAEALQEITKARRSNENIIFGLGHASVAEHAVFNLDIIGVSRLLTEAIETVRLASFTEKSQRYVTFQNDFVIPEELDGQDSLRDEYTQTVGMLFSEYEESIAYLSRLYSREFPALPRNEIAGKAKEDARYILPLATKTQLGMTINARSLENLLRRLAGHPMREARVLYSKLLDPVRAVCPSLVRYVEPDGFSGAFDCSLLPASPSSQLTEVRILDSSCNPDDRILAGLLYENSQSDFDACLHSITSLPTETKGLLWDEVFKGIKAWSKMPRAFELADFSLELTMSESCWAQFKRHRIGTMLKQSNPPQDPLILPAAIRSSERARIWADLHGRCISLAKSLAELHPRVQDYLRLNASPIRVVVKMNLRELYHFVRLRSDEHAQWEIRDLSRRIASRLREFAPRATAFLCGKSELCL